MSSTVVDDGDSRWTRWPGESIRRTEMTATATTSEHAIPKPLPFGKEIEVFYDGDCPLCQREIQMLRKMDHLRRIQFTSITEPEFNPSELGLTQERLMAEIHGRLPDGTIITGVEVFRKMYGAVGFRWVATLSRLPGIRQVLDFGYRVFARNRLRLTGRCQKGICRT
jgi:predicted DCC family thiol-disulfide oxidoreductase YuxK